MSKGGKGDKQSSEIKLPKEIEALAKRNLGAAEAAGKIGFVPYQGPTVAALNPMQVNSMQQNANAMSAFGMQPANVNASIPKAKTYAGGMQGYDPMALYTQAVGKIDPWQRAQINSPMFKSQDPGAGKRTAAAAGLSGGGGGGGGGNTAGGKGGGQMGGPMVLDTNTGQSMVQAPPGSYDAKKWHNNNNNKKRKTSGGK